MHRFFMEEKDVPIGGEVILSREESLHAARVLRLRKGEEIRLLNGENLYRGEVLEVSESGTRVLVTALLPSPEPPVKVTLLQGLPKRDKLETIIQKATELGLWQAMPVEMDRSVAKGERQEKKLERYGRIALEAAKQSGRAHVPEICQTVSLSKLCEAWEKGGRLPWDKVFVAWEEETALPLSCAVRKFWEQAKGQSERQALQIGIVIGPEGGISPRECERLKDLGAVSVTLGKRILRTETAGICALSVIWAAIGEM